MKKYNIKKIKKEECVPLLKHNHYLHKEKSGFRSGFNYGAFDGDELVSLCIFHPPSVPEIVKGCFNLSRDNQGGILELGRLCVLPTIKQKNFLSWFLSRCIKLLKKETCVRALLSYADSSLHTGYIYQATNFGYYGLTSKKKDFWFDLGDGTFRKHQRGPVKGKVGEWRPRTRKHRYLLVMDSKLNCKWDKLPYPKIKNIAPLNKKSPKKEDS